jgi:hypothetical protein
LQTEPFAAALFFEKAQNCKKATADAGYPALHRRFAFKKEE